MENIWVIFIYYITYTNSYGKVIASKALLMLDAIHPDVTLHAKVLKVNFASQRLFKKARYHQVDEENYIRKPIN